MKTNQKKLTREEELAIEYSFFKGSSEGFISWIIPMGAIPLPDDHPLKDIQQQRSKKDA